MKKYAIVTDSTTYLTEEQFTELNIKRGSLNIIEGNDTFRELDVENSLVYEKFDQGKRLTTSQPSPGDFLAIYEDLLKEDYDKIFVLVISEKLSGTYQSAKIALNMLDEPGKVHLFDSKLAAYGNEMLILMLNDMINQNVEYDDIIKKMDGYIANSELIMTSEDLVSMIRSGRLSKTKALIGTVLRIKPVVKMENGKLDLLTSSRTRAKALEHVMQFMKDRMKKDYNKLYVRVCNHNSIEFATKLKEEIERVYKNVELTFSNYIGPVFNVHVGPKGFGVSWTTE